MGIALTPAGEIFLRYASASLTAFDLEILVIAHSRRDVRHSVNIGVSPNVTAYALPVTVLRFKFCQAEILVQVLSGADRNLMHALGIDDHDSMAGRLAANVMSFLPFEPLFE